jgi:succinyl-diaminopimelate desuccinylase
MKDGFGKVSRLIDGYESTMVGTLSKMIEIKAISPSSSGDGESDRADFLQKILESWSIGAKRYDYTDETGTRRSNLVAVLGKRERTIWFIAHIDTVSEGERSLWKGDPFKARVEDGKVYGRGAQDNGQSVVGSMYALKALKESGAKLKYNYGLVLAADEELGSEWGMKKLMKERGLFGRKDMFIVPDSSSPGGKLIEISEKGRLWLKITVKGKQAHASLPDTGINAYRYSIRFLDRLDKELHERFNARDRMFDPDSSTFEMTKHEKNVDSINIIPGLEVCYLDCRILPCYKSDEVLDYIKNVSTNKEYSEVKFEFEALQKDEANKVAPDAEIVVMLKDALKELRGMNAKTIGIGGGTVAAMPRELGMQTVAWESADNMDHLPNEYSRISDMVADSKVFAYLCL